MFFQLRRSDPTHAATHVQPTAAMRMILPSLLLVAAHAFTDSAAQMMCGDFDPTCSPSRGPCTKDSDCCVPGHVCGKENSLCKPQKCDPPGGEGCRCTIGGREAKCLGRLECAPVGPTAGTCQVRRNVSLSVPKNSPKK